MTNPPENPTENPTPSNSAASWESVSAVLDENLDDAGATVSTTVPPMPAAASTNEAPAAEVATPAAVEAAPVTGEATPVTDEATPARPGVEITAAPVVPAPSSSENPAPAGRRWHPGELKLVIEQGMSVGKAFLVSDAEMLVGRRDPDQKTSPDIDLFDQEVPSNRYISRRQARLFFVDGQLMLEDLDSSNGTALNGQLVAPHEPRALSINDRVHFGQSVLLRLTAV